MVDKREKLIYNDMQANLKDLKTKMIDMASHYTQDADELEEYINRVEEILKI